MHLSPSPPHWLLTLVAAMRCLYGLRIPIGLLTVLGLLAAVAVLRV